MNFFEDNIAFLTGASIFIVCILLLVNSRGKKRKEIENEMEAVRGTRKNNSFLNIEKTEDGFSGHIETESGIIASEGKDLQELESNIEEAKSLLNTSGEEFKIDNKSTVEAPLWQNKSEKYSKYSNLKNKTALITAILKEENKPITAFDIKCIYSENFENITTPAVRSFITNLKREGVITSAGRRKDEKSNYTNTLWILNNK